MTTPSVKAQRPKSVRPALAGVWGQAVPSVPTAGALVLCGVFAGRRSNAIPVTVVVIAALSLLGGVLGPLQGDGVPPLPGIVFALAVLWGFSTVEARNWLDR
jgi:hypothetical protein